MNILINTLIALVALAHIFFLTLEMFLWTRPLGMKVFRNSPAKAQETRVLAANQGLYNGFLAAGLIWSLFQSDALFATQIKIFFLSCIVVAGIYGAWSVSRKIFWVQAFPALLALIAILIS